MKRRGDFRTFSVSRLICCWEDQSESAVMSDSVIVFPRARFLTSLTKASGRMAVTFMPIIYDSLSYNTREIPGTSARGAVMRIISTFFIPFIHSLCDLLDCLSVLNEKMEKIVIL